MKFKVQVDGKIWNLELWELEKALLDGTWPIDVQVCHRLYTAGLWQEAKALPIFSRLLTHPAVCLRTRLDQPSLPAVTLFFALGMVIGFLLQTEGHVLYWSTGWTTIVLEGRWWAPVTSIFMHQSKLHLTSNLLLWLYCGYRVESAVGSRLTFALCVACTLSSTLILCVFRDAHYIIGASGILLGVWTVLILLGMVFKLGAHQHKYGWWTWMCFLIMLLGQIGNENISHLVHFSGVLLGIACVLYLKKGNGMTLLYLCFIGGGLALGSSFNRVDYVDWEGEIFHMSLPKNLQYQKAKNFEIWTHLAQPTGYVIQGRDYFRDQCAFIQSDMHKEDVSTTKNGNICVIEHREWTMMFKVIFFGQVRFWSGCVFDAQVQGWHRFCSELLQETSFTEPKNLIVLRKAFENDPSNPLLAFRYAEYLGEIGLFEQADGLYQLLELNDTWHYRAVQSRILLRDQHKIPWDAAFLSHAHPMISSALFHELCRDIEISECNLHSDINKD